jgi:hypothetical protein
MIIIVASIIANIIIINIITASIIISPPMHSLSAQCYTLLPENNYLYHYHYHYHHYHYLLRGRWEENGDD